MFNPWLKNNESCRTSKIHPRFVAARRFVRRARVAHFAVAVSARRKSGEGNRIAGARAAAILSRDQSALPQERRRQAAGMDCGKADWSRDKIAAARAPA